MLNVHFARRAAWVPATGMARLHLEDRLFAGPYGRTNASLALRARFVRPCSLINSACGQHPLCADDRLRNFEVVFGGTTLDLIQGYVYPIGGLRTGPRVSRRFRKSSIGVMSSRLRSETSPSARASKGFLINTRGDPVFIAFAASHRESRSPSGR